MISHGLHDSNRVDLHGPIEARQKSLTIALAVSTLYLLAEVIGGLMANSLALLADAGHMATDVGSLGLALFATWMASRPASVRTTYGFQRVEVLAALTNALSFWAIAIWIFIESYQRFMSPPEVEGPLMLVVGLVGLVVNIIAVWLLKDNAEESLNIEAALIHVIGDLIGSVGVLIAALLVLVFGWRVADPVVGAAIGVLVLLSSSRLLLKVLNVLMQGAPPRLALQRLCQRLEQEGSVTGVHDIHVWSLTTGYDIFSAHITAEIKSVEESSLLLQRLRQIATKDFGVAHVTIQLEESGKECEEAHHIEHGVGQEIL